MNNTKTGRFIAELRKQKKLTQKQLAEQLAVTDKAISKWERGLGYPDIETVLPLAKALDVTANELLMGQRVETDQVNISKVNTIVNNVVSLGEKMSNVKSRNLEITLSIALTTISMLAIIVCGICNIAINNEITWAYYPIGGLVILWFTFMPLINMKKHKLLTALVGLAITSIPYLHLIYSLTDINGIKLLGLPIAVLTILYLLIVTVLISYSKIYKWYIASASVLLLVPYSIIVTRFIEAYLMKKIYYVHNIIGLLFISVIIAYFGYQKRVVKK